MEHEVLVTQGQSDYSISLRPEPDQGYGANSVSDLVESSVGLLGLSWSPPSPTRSDQTSEQENWAKMANRARDEWLRENPF